MRSCSLSILSPPALVIPLTYRSLFNAFQAAFAAFRCAATSHASIFLLFRLTRSGSLFFQLTSSSTGIHCRVIIAAILVLFIQPLRRHARIGVFEQIAKKPTPIAGRRSSRGSSR